MSDTHLGSKFTDMNMLAEDVKEISETEGVFALFAGDILDAGFKSGTPKGLVHDQVIDYRTGRRLAHAMFDEVGHKILATTSGCHGAWTYNETGEYFEKELADKTGTKAFLQHGGIVNLTIGTETYKIFVSHKIPGNSKLNPTRGIFRLNEFGMDFDVGVGAHHHTPSVSIMGRRERNVVGIKCGTYKALDTFANKIGIVQNKMCIPGFYLDAKNHIVIPFMEWRQGLALL